MAPATTPRHSSLHNCSNSSRLSRDLDSRQQTMKITKQSISEKDGAGSATLRPEYPEDLWHAYNLIAVGDSVRADTVRKVQTHNSTTVACGHNDCRSCRRLNWQALDVAAVCSCAPAGEEHGRHRKHQVRPQTHNLVCAGTITQTGSACFQVLANAQRGLAFACKIVYEPQVEEVDFDPATCKIRLKGKNVEENKYVKVRGKRC